MIKAIIFDLGRVIVPFDYMRVFEGLSAHSGLPVDHLHEIRPSYLLPRFESGEIEPRAFASEFCKALNVEIDYPAFCAIWTSIFFPETLISEGLVEALARNYRMVVLSNTNPIHFDMVLATYPLLRHFHALVLSHEVGAMKPSPLIYQKAIEAAGCKAEECFFTDDIQDYVDGARRAGIDAVQFQSQKQIEAELRQRGVAWQN